MKKFWKSGTRINFRKMKSSFHIWEVNHQLCEGCGQHHWNLKFKWKSAKIHKKSGNRINFRKRKSYFHMWEVSIHSVIENSLNKVLRSLPLKKKNLTSELRSRIKNCYYFDSNRTFDLRACADCVRGQESSLSFV